MVRASNRRSAGKKTGLAPSLSRSLKIIGTDTDRSPTYDFLLTFHSKHVPILYRFQDTARYCSKIANFFQLRVFNAQLTGFPWNSVTPDGRKKLEWWVTRSKKSMMITSAVLIQYTIVTEGRTDRHRPTANTASLHSISQWKAASAWKQLLQSFFDRGFVQFWAIGIS